VTAPVISGEPAPGVSAAALIADGGSFRDRANRVYDDGATIVRGVDAGALANWTALQSQAFFQELLKQRKVVATSLLELHSAELSARWAGYLAHERVPFVTYPYEWSFNMLKDAALLHLDILEQAIPFGWTLKDASAYNVQFIGSRAVFIDLPSFIPRASGEPWIGYRQFCMMFLYPLMLSAYKGIDYLPLLRGSLEGVDPGTANQILTGGSRLKKGVFGHVYLHAKMQARYSKRDLDEARSLTEEAGKRPSERKSARHSETMILGMLQGLRNTINKLKSPDEHTTWGSYETDHSYAHTSFEAKKSFIEEVVNERHRSLAWDIGCNTGTFSKIAAENCEYVVALDGDTKAVNRLYERQKAARDERILPIVMDLGNVSPAQGWRGLERKSFENRGKPELILCLALIHHIVISANIPLEEFVGWLRDFDCDVVIESVGLNDEMTQMLLRNRVNQYSELDDTNFERVITEQFTVVRSEPLKGGSRKIFHLTPR
jgi:SAM-dependent methyltransferase